MSYPLPSLALAVFIGLLLLCVTSASQGQDTDGPSESECRPYIEKALQGVNTIQNEDKILEDEGLSLEDTRHSAEDDGDGTSKHDEDLPGRTESDTVSEENLDSVVPDLESTDEVVEDDEGVEKEQSVEEVTDHHSAEETQPESDEQTTDQQSAEINEETTEMSIQQESVEQEKEIDESKETILEDSEQERTEELFDKTSKSLVDSAEDETPVAEASHEESEQSPHVSQETEDEGDSNVEQHEKGDTSQEIQSVETETDDTLQEEQQSLEEPIEIVEENQPSEENLEKEAISEDVQQAEEDSERDTTEDVEKYDNTEEEQPSEEDTASIGVSAEVQQSEEEESIQEDDTETGDKSEQITASEEEQDKESVEAEESVNEETSQEAKSEEETMKEEVSQAESVEETDVKGEQSKETLDKEEEVVPSKEEVDVPKSEEIIGEESPKSEEEQEESAEKAEEQEITKESEEINKNVDTEGLVNEQKENSEEIQLPAEESKSDDTKAEIEEQTEEIAEVETSEEQIRENNEDKQDGNEGEENKEEPPEEEELIMVPEVPEKLRTRDHMAHILHLDAETEEIEHVVSKTVENTLKELKKLYDAAIKPLEILYKYRDLSNRHFGDPEIFSKPLILFMGPWSGGKSTIINYLLENEYKATALRTGADPSPAYFNIVMWGEEPEIVDGTQLAADWTFSGLQKFGQVLLDRLRGLKLNHPLLQKVNIVEIPGILEIRKQVERLFPFNDACQWFIDRADIIFLVYDPSKLDIGPETEAILDQLKGREMQTRIILNKADQVKPEELMRVQGTLIWNISPLMSSTEPPVMYSTSLWSLPYEAGSPTRLLHAQERAFLTDLRSAIDKRVENKIAGARRFAVRVRNHAKMVDCYLTTYYNHKSFFDNKKHVSDDIIEHPQNYHIYEGLSTLTNISRYDLPDPDVYRDFFRLNPVYEFQQLSATCTYFRGCPINRLDLAIAYDLPELIGKYKKSVEELLKTHNTRK